MPVEPVTYDDSSRTDSQESSRSTDRNESSGEASADRMDTPVEKSLTDPLLEADFADCCRLGLPSEQEYQRRWRNRSLPNSPLVNETPIPDDGKIVAGPTDQLFDDDGNLIPAETVTSEEFQSNCALAQYPVDVLENALKELSTQWFNEYEEARNLDRFDDRSDREIITKAFTSACEAFDVSVSTALRQADIDPSGVVYQLRLEQDANNNKEGGEMPPDAVIKAMLMPDDADIEIEGLECPECGGDCSKEGRQMGAADEGQTVFVQCSECGWSERRGY